MTAPALAAEILDFWFDAALESAAAAEARGRVWFGSDPQFDAAIGLRFGGLPERARRGELDSWAHDARSALARIVVLDQFPRNLYRDDARAFACDPAAHTAATAAVEAGFDLQLHPLQAAFVYLPFEHAENAAAQARAVTLFEELTTRAPAGLSDLFEGFADYARRHRDVIARFGRFPHRNALLQRESTAEEAQYLDGGGERFGPRRR